MSTRRTVNQLRNPLFRWTGTRLAHWTLEPKAGARLAPMDGPRGVELVRGPSSGEWVLWQEVAVRPGRWHRVEALVHVDGADEPGSGCALAVEPRSVAPKRREAKSGRVMTPIVRDSAWLRAYYHAGDGVDRVRVGVVLRGAARSCRIDEVRLIPILEPELQSHPLSLPPPDVTLPPPVEARRTLVVTDQPDRPLVHFLRAALGDSGAVRTLPSVKAIHSSDLRGIDALFFPDVDPSRGLGSWSSLLKLAQGRLIVVSLPFLASIAGLKNALRRVDQPDDPIHAAVAHASFVTRGFALRDAFPFAWRGATPGSFQHRQFRRGAALKAWCDRAGCAPVLTSLCDQDATSDRIVSLLKPLNDGAVLAMDVEPIEAEPSTFDEPAAASMLLLNALGRRVAGLGQYIVPPATEAEFRNSMREAAWRFPAIHVHDEDVPIDQVTDQLVTIGDGPTRGSSWGDARPAVLVRTGLSGGDLESVYGAWLYFKNLVRMLPHECPYASALLSRYRLAWLPLCAPWESKLGWRRSDRKRPAEVELGVEDGRLAALIDMAARPRADVGVAVQGPQRVVARLAHWLPRLHAEFGPGAILTRQAARGTLEVEMRDTEGAEVRTAHAWREQRWGLSLHSRPSQPDDDACVSSAIAHASLYARIDVPASDADFSARSPAITGAAATTLEHVIGLIYGLIAVNRGRRPIEFAPFAPVQSGQCLVVPAGDPALDQALASA